MALDSKRSVLSGKDLLKDFQEEKVQMKLKAFQMHELSVLNEGIFRFLETEKVQTKAAAATSKNLTAYFEFLASGAKEAAAHFADLYMSQTYPAAVAFMSSKCKGLTKLMVEYIKNIK